MEQRVFPMLSYEDVGRAADWIAQAFGFEERERFADDDGTAATILSEPEESQELGERRYRVEDVEGHRWMFVQAI